MLDPATRSEVIRLFYAEHFTMNGIAESLGIHHETVKSIIQTKQFSKARVLRPSMLDPYRDFIERTLADHPRIRATRLRHMLRDRGFKGGVSLLRGYLRQIRPKRGQAFLPLTFLPGQQAQVDWAHFGKLAVEGSERKLYCFVLVLSHSRAMYARFCFDMEQDTFRRCHVEGFHYLGGVSRVLLYDNLKSVVIERYGRDLSLNKQHMEFAAHYRFKPEACAVRAGWQKGRVERSIRYIRDNFFAARGFRDLGDANEQLRKWLDEVANKRPWPGGAERSVQDVWQEERQNLMTLPEHDFPTDQILTRRASKYPFIRFDRNEYSIPYEHVGDPVTIVADEAEVRIVIKEREIARHERSYAKGKRIRNPEHLSGIIKDRPKGFGASMQDTLVFLVPEAAKLIGMLLEQGQPVGKHIQKLIELVDDYGVERVRGKVLEALGNGQPRATTVAQLLVLEAKRSKEKLSLPVMLPDRPGVKDLAVTYPDLATYDQLGKEATDDA